MKILLLPALLVSALPPLQAQTSRTPSAGGALSTIQAARLAGPGATVTVRGIVSNGSELGQLRFVQDKQAGLATFSLNNPNFAALQLGDSVLLTGTLKNYSGLLEMDPVATVQKLAGGRRVPMLETTAAGAEALFTEANEGRLIRIKGLSSLTAPDGTPAEALKGNTNYLLDGQKTTPIRINIASTGETGLVGKTIPAGEYELLGMLSQFTNTGTGGYQLLPRRATDFVVGGGLPVIVGEPVPTAISRTGFTVQFSTRNAGTATVEYGKTNALGQKVQLTTPGTSHTVDLTGLEPGTVYYVRVSATNTVGTSAAPAVPMITDTKKRSSRQ
ncbi:fibronectin type III domain-containing protein [Hymenobacter canadensis]|uniref:Fibronectin type III domain-containing protein n=1 Tax=Hymenobacter canadensis TaxID=2999067 RepID=A0ABY7LVU2_9BACT|nr:fibronectin type III domain-containing protein [Hymenobacter canadensis]WBA43390.1 fibronectin type III domain-containing protein [Hymenobacter canadensis]